MATFKDVLVKALNDGKMNLYSVNQNLMEVSRQTKKKPAYLKVAVGEDLVDGIMRRERVAFVIEMDGDELNEIANDFNGLPKATDSTE
jgi:hypothetical protein